MAKTTPPFSVENEINANQPDLLGNPEFPADMDMDMPEVPTEAPPPVPTVKPLVNEKDTVAVPHEYRNGIYDQVAGQRDVNTPQAVTKSGKNVVDLGNKGEYIDSFWVAEAARAANDAALPEWIGGKNGQELLVAATKSIADIYKGRDMSNPAVLQQAANDAIRSYNIREGEAASFRKALMMMLMNNKEWAFSVKDRGEGQRKLGIVRSLQEGNAIRLDPSNPEHIELSKRLTRQNIIWSNAAELAQEKKTSDYNAQQAAQLESGRKQMIANANKKEHKADYEKWKKTHGIEGEPTYEQIGAFFDSGLSQPLSDHLKKSQQTISTNDFNKWKDENPDKWSEDDQAGAVAAYNNSRVEEIKMKTASRDERYQKHLKQNEGEVASPEGYKAFQESDARSRAGSARDDVGSQVVSQNEPWTFGITVDAVRAQQKKNIDEGKVRRGKGFDNSFQAVLSRMEKDDFGGGESQAILSEGEIKYLESQTKDSLYIQKTISDEISGYQDLIEPDDNGVEQVTPEQKQMYLDKIAALQNEKKAELQRFEEIRSGLTKVRDWQNQVLSKGAADGETVPWHMFDYTRPGDTSFYKNREPDSGGGTPQPLGGGEKITGDDHVARANEFTGSTDADVQGRTESLESGLGEYKSKVEELTTIRTDKEKQLYALKEELRNPSPLEALPEGKRDTPDEIRRKIEDIEGVLQGINSSLDEYAIKVKEVEGRLAENKETNLDTVTAFQNAPDWGSGRTGMREIVANAKSLDDLEVAIRKQISDFEERYGKETRDNNSGQTYKTVDPNGENGADYELLKKWSEWLKEIEKLGEDSWPEIKSELTKEE